MISVCIPTKDVEATIQKTLDSVRRFSEVVIYDTGSTDATLVIASSYPNVKIQKGGFKGFGPLRNEVAKLASNDWIFALDSDESVSPALLAEIERLSLNPSNAYSMPRHNYYNGKWIKGCGWYPDRVVRLYNKQTARYSDAAVHESVQSRHITPLRSPLLHTPCRSLSDFLRKMDHYSTLFAEQNKGKRRASFSKALGHGAYAFFKSYLLQRGIFDGPEGFVISLYNANSTFYKYLKLSEKNQS